MPLAGMQAEGRPRRKGPWLVRARARGRDWSPVQRRSACQVLLSFAVAALAEIAGCFAFWAWFRLGASAAWLVPGLAALALFAALLAQSEAAAAGRTYAAYGGIYIAAALLWLWLVEGVRPDRWDLIGAAVCLLGAGLILYGPRST